MTQLYDFYAIYEFIYILERKKYTTFLVQKERKNRKDFYSLLLDFDKIVLRV